MSGRNFCTGVNNDGRACGVTLSSLSSGRCHHHWGQSYEEQRVLREKAARKREVFQRPQYAVAANGDLIVGPVGTQPIVDSLAAAPAEEPEADKCIYCDGKGTRTEYVGSRFVGSNPQAHPVTKTCWSCHGSGKDAALAEER